MNLLSINLFKIRGINMELNGKKIVFLGDSITEGYNYTVAPIG